MATTLTTCGVCAASIASSARACPKCGAPQRAATNTAGRSVARVTAMLVAFFAALGVWNYYGNPYDTDKLAASALALAAAAAVFGLTFRR